MTRWFRCYQTLALSKLDLDDGPGFLEVGCGPGWAVREAAKRLQSGCCAGIDISPKMIEKAQAQSQDGENVEFHVANAESIPYPDMTFHSILCTNSFHHYKTPLKALGEIRRVLRREGTFVLLDSARDVSLAIWLQDRLRRYLEPSHMRYYTTTEIQDLLSTAHWELKSPIHTIKNFNDQGKTFTGLMLMQCGK